MKSHFRSSLFFLIVANLYCFDVKADLPGTAYQYDQYSQKGNVYFRSIPFYWLDLTDFGKTIVYDTKTNNALYKVEKYMPVGSFISNNGKTIISIIDWIGQSEPEKEDVLNVFLDGRKIKTYTIGSFMKEKLTITYTTSHSYWYKNIFMNDDTLFIQTLDEQVILLDGNSGSIIKISDEELITQRFDMEKLPLAKRIVYDSIKYPDRNTIPNLRNGNSFTKSFLRHLKKKETENYDSATYYISISVIIDRNGHADIFYLSTNDEKQGKPFSVEKIEAWIRKQKFKTDLIPINADKWVFEKYFYLF